ncbi:MAG: hypothetical protein LZ174_06980 [Thaumarchaeota archaeon]|jgi:hypothetical protein|nr:hypothetical protein [Candidatus Geocrenenecus arthurdayi]
MKRIFRIKGEEEEASFKIAYRTRQSRPPRPEPTSQELLFRLLDLRIKREVDGEAFFELLKEYLGRASRTGIDMDRLREYAGRLRDLGDSETLKILESVEPGVGGGV